MAATTPSFPAASPVQPRAAMVELHNETPAPVAAWVSPSASDPAMTTAIGSTSASTIPVPAPSPVTATSSIKAVDPTSSLGDASIQAINAVTPNLPATPPAAPIHTSFSQMPELMTPHEFTDPAIQQAVTDFVKATAHLGVIVSGHEIVLYDNVAFSSTLTSNSFDSLTFTFHDGSSVSLVGTPAELSASHWIH